MWVILPHAVVGYHAHISPQWGCIISFNQFACTVFCREDGHMKFIPVQKLEEQFTHLFQADWRNADLFASFANCGLACGLALLESASRPVDLSRPQTALLFD